MYAFKIISKQDDAIDMNKINNEEPQNNQPQNSEMKPRQHFEEYKKIYLTAFILAAQKKRLCNKAEEIIQCLERIQNAQQEIFHAEGGDRSEQSKRREQNAIKRARRKADDIERKWECREQYCGRKYGAHASLLQHVKLKHPNVYDQYCEI